MSRKKIYILSSIAIIFVAAILWGCIYLFAPKSYEDLIPAQAKMVVRLQPSESNAQDLKNIIDAVGISTEGVDASQPLYAFITPNEYIGFVAKVADENAIKKAFNGLVVQKKCQSIEISDGQNWVWINSGWLVTWTSRYLLAIGPGLASERDVLRQTAISLANSGDCFKDSPSFKRLRDEKGFMQIFALMDALPTPYNMIFRQNIPSSCDPSAVEIYASAEKSKGGKTLINSHIESENQDILACIDQYEKSKKHLDVMNQTAVDSALFYMATSFQGKDLLDILKTDATLRGLLLGINQTIDADKIMGSTNGVFSIELGGFNKDWTPTFCVKGESPLYNLFADADYWMESAKKQHHVTLKRISSNDYFLSNEKEQVKFGQNVQQGIYYFATPSMESRISAPIFMQESNTKKDPIIYLSINLRHLFQQPSMQEGAISTILKTLLPGSNRLTYKSFVGRKGQMIIE